MAQSGYIKGQPDASYWMTEIRRGIAYRKKYANESEWDKWRSWYRGKWSPQILPVNLYFRMLRTVVPRVYFRNPSISITNTRPGLEFEVLAQLIERLDNKLIRTMGVKNTIKRAVQHAWMFGTGVVLSGYGGAHQFTPDSIDNALPVKGDMRLEYNTNIADNMPWLLPCHPGAFIVPAGCDTFDNARWFAQWVKRPLFEVMSDRRLKHVRDLKPSNSKETFKLPSGIEMATNAEMVDLVIVRDKLFKKVFVLAPFSSDRVLYYEDDGMQINGRMGAYPLIFNEDDEVFWGVSDSMILDPQQRELNEIRTLQMKHRRLSIVKAFMKGNAMDIEEIEKMTSEEVLSVVKIKGDMSDVDFRIVAQEPQMLRTAANEVMNDVRENLGFSRNQAGNYDSGMGGGGSRASATEAQIVQAASEIRIDERRDMCADLLVDAFTDINTMIFNHWKDDQVVGILGPNSLPYWVAFKPAALNGVEYLMDIDPDSALPETKQIRTQKAVQSYTLLKENPLIDPEKLTKYLLRELHGTDFDELMRGLGAMRSETGGNPDQPLTPEQYMEIVAQQTPPQ